MPRAPKVLQVAAVDATVRCLLRPLIERLQAEGFDVHVACSPGERPLGLPGVTHWPVPIARRIVALSHLRAAWHLFRLIQAERFDVVHVHTPVAAALGRLAARAAGTPHIVYTAHGFYFHDRMAAAPRRALIWLERALGACTDWLFSQSGEDAETAVRERICPADRVRWIGNGVDVARFAQAQGGQDLRGQLGLRPAQRVVGFIGRLVREKGVLELIEAFGRVCRALPEARLVVVGDTLDSDRDGGAKARIADLIRALELEDAIVFTGHRGDVPELLACLDVFVLPSHREGMPRSILEAMAAGLPVVATRIRGCREEVVHGETGFLVPVADPPALAEALLRLLKDPARARAMGRAGQRRAFEQFDEAAVLDRQMAVFRGLLPGGQR